MSEEQKAPTVTIKPSEEIVKQANEVVVISAGNMTIGMKKPGVLRQYQIVEVVGDSAKNGVYMGMILPLLWVVSVDGDDLPPIGSKLELESLISRLGEDGVNAVATHWQEKNKASSGQVESVKN